MLSVNNMPNFKLFENIDVKFDKVFLTYCTQNIFHLQLCNLLFMSLSGFSGRNLRQGTCAPWAQFFFRSMQFSRKINLITDGIGQMVERHRIQSWYVI